MLTTLAVSGYRTLRDFVVPLTRLTVVTGANGSGKSSLYRSVRLLADVAQGRVVAALAAEGGLASTLWAGPEAFSRAMVEGSVPVQGLVRRERVALKLGIADADYGYAIDLGLPIPLAGSAFNEDPEIKAEAVWAGQALSRRNLLADRRGPAVHTRDDSGKRVTAMTALAAYDSMMTFAAHPRSAPELIVVRERLRAWRFYDQLRTDRDAPARMPHVGTRTPALASDGCDLAAALQTISEIGDGRALAGCISDAFPGADLEIGGDNGRLQVELRQHGLLRPLKATELSDGTLRYLLLVAALLTPRPPPLLVLNEPETSLHPDLLAPLARLITAASAETQIIVVSHAAALVSALAADASASVIHLEKTLGETHARGVARPAWEWPSR
jgi:predicted ATPase